MSNPLNLRQQYERFSWHISRELKLNRKIVKLNPEMRIELLEENMTLKALRHLEEIRYESRTRRFANEVEYYGSWKFYEVRENLHDKLLRKGTFLGSWMLKIAKKKLIEEFEFKGSGKFAIVISVE